MPSIVKAGCIRDVGRSQNREHLQDDKPATEEQKPLGQVIPTESIDAETKEKLLGDELYALRRKVESERESIIKQAHENARRITEEAEERRKAIVAEAEEQAGVILQEAETVGYQQGYKNGTRESTANSEEKIKACAEDIREMVQFIKEENSRAIQDNESDLVQLSFEIAKKIMRQQIKADDEAIPKMIEEIIRENEKTVKVYLSEFNRMLKFKVDRRMYSRIKSLSENLRVIVIKEDEDAHRQDTIQVETETGMIDAGISGQMNRLKAELDIKE